MFGKSATNIHHKSFEMLAKDLQIEFDSSPPDQSEAQEVSHDHLPPPPNHTPHHFLAWLWNSI